MIHRTGTTKGHAQVSEIGSDKRRKEVHRTVERAAKKISAAMDKMVGDLPEVAAPQMATEMLAHALFERQPVLMDWLALSDSAKDVWRRLFKEEYQRQLEAYESRRAARKARATGI